VLEPAAVCESWSRVRLIRAERNPKSGALTKLRPKLLRPSSRRLKIGRVMKRRVHAAVLSLALLAASAVVPCVAQSSSETTPISNKGRTGRHPYVTAGDRTYLIGTQDGNFPDMGDHVPGEMGGLWMPPIKLIDAFQARIAELEQ
jgi:hypothetical protein